MHALHLRAEDLQVLKFSSAIKLEVTVHLLGNTALLTQHLNSGAPFLFDMDGVLYSYKQLAAWLRPLRRSMFIELMRRAGQEPTTEELTHFCSLNEQNMGAWRKFCDTIADEVFRLTDKRFTSDDTRKLSVELADSALQQVKLEIVAGLPEFLMLWPTTPRWVVTASLKGVAEKIIAQLNLSSTMGFVLSDCGKPELLPKPSPWMWEQAYIGITGQRLDNSSNAIVFEDALKNIVQLVQYAGLTFVVIAPESIEKSAEEILQHPELKTTFDAGRIVVTKDFHPLITLGR